MKEITKALLKAQGEFTKITKDGKNDHFKNQYASLPNVLKVVLPILRENGILLTISTIQKEEKNYTHVRLIHIETMEILESHLPILNITDSQKMGSCITYNQRYGLLPLLGIAADIDDDGNNASNRDPKEIEKKKAQLTNMIKGYDYGDKIEVYINNLIANKDAPTDKLDQAIIRLSELATQEVKIEVDKSTAK